MALGEARVEIKPDLSAFDAQLRKGVTDALNKVQTEADKTGEAVEDSFREAARQVEDSLDSISAGNPFASLNADAERSGEVIEDSFREAARQSESALDGIGGGFGKIAAGLGGVLAGVGLGSFLADATVEAQAANSALANTAQLIESTGGKAGVTQEQITALADSMRFSIGIDDTAVIEASNALLTFTNVSGPIFDETITRAADLSAVLGTDLQGATMQLGKALNDPIKGMSALSRSGVSFTAEQKATVKAMVEAGDAAGAQRLILDELAVQFGGTAEASAKSTDRIAANFGELKEAVGAGLIGALDQVTPGLLELADSLMGPMEQVGEALGSFAGPLLDALGPSISVLVTQFAQVLLDLGGIFSSLAPLIEPIVQIVGVLATALSGSLLAVFDALAPVIVQVGEYLGIMADIIGEALFGVIDALAPILMEVGMMLSDYLAEILPVVLDLFREIAPIIGQVAGVLGNVFAGALRVLLPVLSKLITSLLTSLAPILPVLLDAFMQVADVIGGAFLRVLTTVLPPIGILIAELVAGLAPILPTIIDAFLRIVLALEPLIPALLEIVTTLLPPLSQLLLALVPIITQVVGWLADGLATAIENLAPLLETVIGWVVLLAEDIGVLVSWLADNLQPAFDAIVAYIVDELVPAFQQIWAFIRDNVIPVFAAIATKVAEVAAAVGTKITEIVGFVTGLPGRISATISTLWNGLRDGITAAKDWIGQKIDEVVGFVTGLPDRLRQGLANIASAGLAIGAAFINSLKDGITGVAGFAKDVATAIVGAFKSAWNTVAREINNFLPNNIGVGPFAIDLPDNPIPTFADGTIAYGPTMGIFGEAGAEAVIPITRPRRALELMEQSGLADLARSTSGGGALVNIQSAVFATPSDADLVAQRVLAAQRSRSFAA
jgi:phage-related protein